MNTIKKNESHMFADTIHNKKSSNLNSKKCVNTVVHKSTIKSKVTDDKSNIVTSSKSNKHFFVTKRKYSTILSEDDSKSLAISDPSLLSFNSIASSDTAANYNNYFHENSLYYCK